MLLPDNDHRNRFIKGRANPGRCVSPPALSATSSNAVIVGLIAADDDVVVGLDTDVFGKMVADVSFSSSSSSSLSESLSRLTGCIYNSTLEGRFGDVINSNVPFDPIFLWPSVHLNSSMPPVQSRTQDIQRYDQGFVLV